MFLNSTESNVIETDDIDSGEKAFVFPVSFAQQRLWFMEQLEPGNPVYNTPVAYRITGTFRADVLDQSMNEIVRRHEVLRTFFRTQAGRPIQIILPKLDFQLQIVDLGSVSGNRKELELQFLIRSETQRSFDLRQCPLVRVTLFTVSLGQYVLMITTHHIVFDGWSQGLFFNELTSFYRSFSAGNPSPFSRLPIQYADFSVWQRQWLAGSVLEEQLTYWKRQLAGSHPSSELPTDRPRPEFQRYRGSNQSFVMPKKLGSDLEQASRKENVTLFMILLAAFKVLIYRYTGQRDSLVGTPIANRNYSKIENLIGFFVNTLVIRTQITGSHTFREYLGHVREVTLDAYDHQDIPFEMLIEHIQPERDLSRNPLFQVMFIVQNAPRRPLEFEGLTVAPVDFVDGVSKFDLTLSVENTDEELLIAFEYNTDLFDASTIIRIASHFKLLLEGIRSNADRLICELPILTDQEKRQLIVEWNETQEQYDRRPCIQQLFEDQVKRAPDVVALVFEEQHLTYTMLNRKGNQIAHYLRALGVGPEVLVGIYMQRSLDMMVGLMGILKAGGAYVPLDPTYPRERLEFMLQDTGASVLVTERQVEQLLKNDANLIYMDTDWDRIAQKCEMNPVNYITDDNPSYILFTSGSTGKPKGVIGLHRCAINRLKWMWKEYPFENGEVCCQKTSMSFGDSIWECFGALLRGIRTVIIDDDIIKVPQQFIHCLACEQVSRIVVVPSLLNFILDQYSDLQQRLPQLKYWISSGETLTGQLARHFCELMPRAKLLNLYGSTEVSHDVSCYEIEPDKLMSFVPIGRPISNTQAYIFDHDDQLVPVRVRGELIIGGSGVVRGYYGHPELSAARFIPDPFGRVIGGRLYRTGDTTRYLQDGNIEFLGRMDHLVKIAGFRVEPGEIESILRQHSSVSEAVVVAHEDHQSNKRLVAYVIQKSTVTTSMDSLRQFLKRKLPYYMVPTAFVTIQTFPLTPNGKIDRLALPKPDRTGEERSHIAPRTPSERTMVNIWAEVIDREDIGVYDNFFELGGHSLLGTRVLSRIHEAFDVDLPLRKLFESPNVAQLTEAVEEAIFAKADRDKIEELMLLVETIPEDKLPKESF